MRALFARSLAVALLSVSSLSAAQSDGRIGTLKDTQGEVWIGKATARQAGTSGAGVKAADHLSTGQTGAATVTLKDGTLLTMGPHTSMDLSTFTFNATTQEGSFLLDLLQGSVRVVTGLIGKSSPDKFKVKTPTSVVGVRGTDFIVQTETLN